MAVQRIRSGLGTNPLIVIAAAKAVAQKAFKKRNPRGLTTLERSFYNRLIEQKLGATTKTGRSRCIVSRIAPKAVKRASSGDAHGTAA